MSIVTYFLVEPTKRYGGAVGYDDNTTLSTL